MPAAFSNHSVGRPCWRFRCRGIIRSLMIRAKKTSLPIPAVGRWGGRFSAVDRLIWPLLIICLLYSATFVWTLPPLNSDEAVFGRAAQSILRGDLLVFASLTYCGAPKTYLDAPLVLFFGPQDWTLRFWPVLFRLVQAALTYLILRKFLPRTFAFAGGLIMTVWAYPVMFLLLFGTPYSLMVTLWLSLIYVATLILFEERNFARWFWLLGALSGLSLWTYPQSLLVIAPTTATAFLSLKGRSRFAALAARWTLGCLLSSLPWWHYNIVETWMGTFRENAIASLPGGSSLKARLIAARNNWDYFLFEKLDDALGEPSLWFPNGWLNSYVQQVTVILAGGLLIFAGWFAISSVTSYGWQLVRTRFMPRGTVTGKLSPSERAAFFWVGIVLGVMVTWGLATGVSTAGTVRGAVERYTLPFVIVAPFFVPYCCSRLRRVGEVLVLIVAGLLCLPALLDAANLPFRLEMRDAQRAQNDAIEKLIRTSGARFVAGDYWDVERLEFRFPDRLVAIHLTNELDRQYLTEEYLPPREHPSAGDGLLVLRTGSPLESAALRLGYGCLPQLSAPPGYRILVVDDQTENCPAAAAFFAKIDFERQLDQFRSGGINRLVLTDRLRGRRVDAQGVPHASFAVDQPGVYVAFGPYIPLAAGRYRLRLLFNDVSPGDGGVRSGSRRAEETGCRVVADVVSDLGMKTYWREELEVDASTVIEGEFDAPGSGPAGPFFETRVFAARVSRPVRLVEVSLHRIDGTASDRAPTGRQPMAR